MVRIPGQRRARAGRDVGQPVEHAGKTTQGAGEVLDQVVNPALGTAAEGIAVVKKDLAETRANIAEIAASLRRAMEAEAEAAKAVNKELGAKEHVSDTARTTARGATATIEGGVKDMKTDVAEMDAWHKALLAANVTLEEVETSLGGMAPNISAGSKDAERTAQALGTAGTTWVDFGQGT